jgi:DNA-binding transcriptional LysR family regulator
MGCNEYLHRTPWFRIAGMDYPDFNLLVTLDAILTEGSVAGAARRLGLSDSAMSRALARLRAATSDPLLVRAGRGLVPTPRAIALREPVHRLVEEAHAALRPAAALDLSRLARTFTLRIREGFVENFGAALVSRVAQEAPGVRLHFMPKTDRDSTLLREGTVDLETGIVGKEASPEVRTRALFRDRFVGVVRSGHPLARGRMSLARYLAAGHVLVARQGGRQAPVDVALESAGAGRSIAAATGSFAAALALARASELVATVPERQTGVLREGMHSFALPVEVAPLTVSMLWHPRMDADPAHRWLRGLVLETCA